MDDIERAYLLLALHLGRHFEGFVDAYYGPAELKEAVQVGPLRPLDGLAGDARELLEAIEDSGYDLQRQDFLTRQVRAMGAVIQSLSGHPLGFVQEAELYFDIRPERIDEATFEAAHAELDEMLPGTSPLIERLAIWKKGFELNPERVLPVFDLARQETRRRTADLFDLPEGEEMSLVLVQGQAWSAYNWYLGNYRSRIELNTDLPVRASSAVPLMAHEAYPGHHTEHAVKEALLYHGQGRAEHTVQLLLAPEAVISEGIADSAANMIFSDADLAAFLREELYPAAGLVGVDIDRQLRIARLMEALGGVSGNAALLLHRDGRHPDDVRRYVEHYALRTPQEAEQTMKFIRHPLFRSYTFNYQLGKALVAPLLDGPEATDHFRRLLSEPLTPTQVRQWVFGRA